MHTSMALGWLAAGILALTPGIARADTPEPLILEPSSAWNVNYADDSCRLARTFSANSETVAFIADQFEPGPILQVLVAGKVFRLYAGRKVTAAFGPSGAKTTISRATDATFGKFGPAVMVGPIRLVRKESETATSAVTSGALAAVEAATPEQERAISWFELDRGSGRPVRFALGPMHEAMKAMRACTDELLTHWGIDAAAHRSLSRRAIPTGNPGKWVSNSDYPAHLVDRGIQGLIQFRLSIDAAGKVSGCAIQQSTRPAEFDKKVCQIMVQRARFDPALDAAGRPIASYWRSSFRFQIP